MTTRMTHAAWRLARGAYLASTAGMVGSTVGLVTLIFLFPLVLPAQGLVEVAGAAGSIAEAVEVAADGSIVRMLLLCGCSTIRDAVDEYRDWRDSQTNAPAVPPDAPGAPPATPGTPTQPDTPAADEADYSAFTWAYGGFNGSRAALSEPRIASLRMNGMSGLSYRWAGPNLSAWGLSHTDAGALACLFLQRADGSWVGGKFDWISSSRTTRDFKNLGGYQGWTLAGIPNPCRAAFVIVSADGRRRSNVITADWRR